MSNPRRTIKKKPLKTVSRTKTKHATKGAPAASAVRDEILLHAHRILKKWLKVCSSKPLLRKKIHNFQAQDFHVDLSLITAAQMKELNTQYRHKAEPTDVLSFPADEFFQMQGLLGDVVICTPVLLKQAEEAGHSWKHEFDVLLVHGILHLLHFDHETGAKDALEMQKWEQKLLGVKVKKGLIKRSTQKPRSQSVRA